MMEKEKMEGEHNATRHMVSSDVLQLCSLAGLIKRLKFEEVINATDSISPNKHAKTNKHFINGRRWSSTIGDD